MAAGEREGDLLALVAAERRHERRIDVVDLDLGRVTFDPVGEVHSVAGLCELARPDDVDGREIVTLGMADVVGGDLGQKLGVAENVDIDLGAGQRLELRRERRQHRSELIVLRRKVQRHAVIGLVRSLRTREANRSERAERNRRRATDERFHGGLLPFLVITNASTAIFPRSIKFCSARSGTNERAVASD